MRTKTVHKTISALLLISILMASLVTTQAAGIEPRFTGISSLSSGLSISSNGGAKCSGVAIVRSGYTVDLTVELKQDGNTIKTWTASGSDRVSAGGTYYVMSGHEYVVTTTAEVYEGRTLVESPSTDSLTSSY